MYPNPTFRFAARCLLLACGMSGAIAAAAAEPAPPDAAPMSVVGEVLGIVLPVALIIVALFAVLYFVRRRYGLAGRDAPLSVLQILPVGSRERIVVVKSRSGRCFAVGVGAQSVTLITELERADVESAAPAPPLTDASDSLNPSAR